MKLSWQSRSSIIINISFILSLLALVWWPVNPLTVFSITITNPGNVVIAGNRVLYEVKYHKWIAKICTVHRQLINSRTIVYTPFQSNLPVSERPVDTKTNYLDTSTGDMPGKYYIRTTYAFRYFHFRDVEVVADSNLFQMVAHHDELAEGKEGKQGKRGADGKDGKPGRDFWGRR